MSYKNLDQQNLSFLKELLSTNSPSGYEVNAAKVWQNYVNQFAEVSGDVLNNSIGVLNPQAEFKIMIAGHYDEIGLQVMYISKEGYLYVRRLGGIDLLSLPGSEVVVITKKGTISGVLGKIPIHVQSPTERTKAIELEDLWIDIGVDSEEEAANLVEVGDPVAIKSNFHYLGQHKIVSKGMDDKIGAFIVAEVLRNLSTQQLKVGVYGVATSQEELGARGAITSAFKVNPHVGFCLDVGIATDVPGIEERKYGKMRLGGGASITHSADNNVVLVRLLQQTAQQNNIQYQDVASKSATGGTDTAHMQLARQGVATALISVPNRYMHTQVEMCDLRDVDEIISLLVETIKVIDKDAIVDFVPSHM